VHCELDVHTFLPVAPHNVISIGLELEPEAEAEAEARQVTRCTAGAVLAFGESWAVRAGLRRCPSVTARWKRITSPTAA
jgi:hypothetical protein